MNRRSAMRILISASAGFLFLLRSAHGQSGQTHIYYSTLRFAAHVHKISL